MRVWWLPLASLVFASLGAPQAHAEAYTKVTINGVVTPVSFNDGDSFRIQAGPMKGTQARLSGYNTLESFGPVPAWGPGTEKEMFVLAKMSTARAKKGVWSCEGDGSKDGYGRLLLFCKDLAAELIKHGLAHAYSVDEKPADADLLAVQKEAVRERRGMWAHGVPRFVMTSLHSKDEGGDKDGKTSNRLISTRDGHSEKWQHEDAYKECQKVCHQVPTFADADLDKLQELLKADAEAGGVVTAMDANKFRNTVRALLESSLAGEEVWVTSDTVQGVRLPAGVTEEDLGPMIGAIKRLSSEQKLPPATGLRVDSCQVYVDFKRRFGGDRAECLR
jgi:endonuclease YncB( thermonuclease family)